MIQATVLVSLPEGAEQLSVETYSEIVIWGSETPGLSSTWIVNWQVLADSSLMSASFESPAQGVQVPSPLKAGLPPGVGILMSGPGASLDEWTVVIENYVGTREAFSYCLWLQGVTSTGTKHFRFHDPTIVVTMEPMG